MSKPAEEKGAAPSGIARFLTNAVKWVLFPLALLIGFSLRLAPDIWIQLGGSNYCVWFDEVWTLMVSRLRVRDALYFIHHFDANPPLSYLFLRLAPQQPDGTILRIVPGVFGAAALGLFIWQARRHFKGEWLWLAGALFALSPLHVWYSLNLRYYALMDVIAVGWFFLTARLLAAGRSAKGGGAEVQPSLVHGWLFVSILGMLTHNLFAAAWLAGIVALWAGLGAGFLRIFAMPWRYSWIALPLAYWAQVFIWQREFAFGYETSLSMPTPAMLFSALNDYLILYGMMPGTPLQISAGALVTLGPVAYLAWDAYAARRGGKLAAAIVPISLWLALLPPTMLYAAAHVLGNPQLFSRRYMIPSAVALLVAWALGVMRLKLRPIQCSIVAVLLTLNLMGLYAVFKIQHPPDWKSAANWIAAQNDGSRWAITREPVDNFVVSESSCLQTYLPEVKSENLRHFALSPLGSANQPRRLRANVDSIGGSAKIGFERYYPPHYSFAEFEESLDSDSEDLPDEIMVAYFISGDFFPSPQEDMGGFLSPMYAYEGSREFPGVRVDLWVKN